MKTALYPGTFDPVTSGHIDILDRAAPLFERVVVTVAVNQSKKAMLESDQRVELIERSCRELLSHHPQIEVIRFDGLLVDCAREQGATAIIRGLRTLGDFEYEMQMAVMNRRLLPGLDTLFLPADEKYMHLSSSIVRDLARHGADLTGLVPEVVAAALTQKFDI